MQTFYAVLVILVVLLGGLAVFVRTAPSDLETWHVDPISVEPPRGKSYVLLRPGSPDGDGPLLNEAPEAALAAFD
ncbi:MAG: hypothetical protein AAGH83_10480, partial [Pseudomonadota bacterium]